MLRALKNLARRFRLRSFERGDLTSADERPVENVDAMAAAGASAPDATGGRLMSAIPPGYIKTYDEGRPRH